MGHAVEIEYESGASSDSTSEGSSPDESSTGDVKIEVRVPLNYSQTHVDAQSKASRLGPRHPDLDAHLYHLNNRRGELWLVRGVSPEERTFHRALEKFDF